MKREHILQQQSPLPSEYRQLEYIESTGTQYIDTNLSVAGHNRDVEWNIDYQFTTTDTGYIITNTGTYNSYSIYVHLAAYNTTTVEGICYRNATGTRTAQINSMLNRHTYRVDFVTGNCYCDDLLMFTLPIDNYINNVSGTTQLFCRLVNNQPYLVGHAKLRRSTIRIQDTLHDLIPALRISDLKPGLYDIINNQFYTNAGTGEFLYT